MKKAVLVCVSVLVMAALVAAPAAAAANFNFGVKAGLSMANNVWTDDDGSEKSLFRPTFGAFALINLTSMIAIQPEISYLTTGEWWTNDGAKVVESFNYLHVPVLIRARLMNEGKFVPIVFAGPAVGFLLSAKETGEGDIKSFFKSTDFGADFGVGGEIGLEKMKVVIDLRYYLGLSNAYNNFSPGFSMKNRAFILTAGLIF